MIGKYGDGWDGENYGDEMYLDELVGGDGLESKDELSVNGGCGKVEYMG